MYENRARWRPTWTLLTALACVALAACGSSNTPAPQATESGETLEEAYQAALAAGGEVVWYESSPPDAIAVVTEAFEARFPGLTLKHVRLTGGESVTRMVTEAQAGQKTADVVTPSTDALSDLVQRDLVQCVTWSNYGIKDELTYDCWGLRTSVSPFVLAYNKDLVAPGDLPKSWDDLLDPKWKGKIGMWIQPFTISLLAADWGIERVEQYARDILANEPVFMESTFPVTQAVVAGELPLGLVTLQAMFAPMESGAPVDYIFLDPTPTAEITSLVPVAAANPAGGRLLAAWLHTEGQAAFEKGTRRGHPQIETSAYHDLLADVRMVGPGWEDADDLTEWNTIVSDIWGAG